MLSGLRHPPRLIDALMSGVHKMKESATYQAILAKGEAKGRAKGRAEGERATLIRVASEKLGPPDTKTLAALGAIREAARLGALARCLWKASTWAELLAQETS